MPHTKRTWQHVQRNLTSRASSRSLVRKLSAGPRKQTSSYAAAQSSSQSGRQVQSFVLRCITPARLASTSHVAHSISCLTARRLSPVATRSSTLRSKKSFNLLAHCTIDGMDVSRFFSFFSTSLRAIRSSLRTKAEDTSTLPSHLSKLFARAFKRIVSSLVALVHGSLRWGFARWKEPTSLMTTMSSKDLFGSRSAAKGEVCSSSSGSKPLSVSGYSSESNRDSE
jgi:hypothetical protein